MASLGQDGRSRSPGTAARGASFSPLVQIQPGSGRTPFFCVHGAGGNVLNFRDIARRLGEEQGVYALQAHGVEGAPQLESIERTAEAYIAEIRRVQPRGPYLIGGYSAGGVIAFEMGRQLRASDDGMGLVALLDTFAPGIRPQRTPLRQHASRLLEEGPSYVRRRAEKKLRERIEDVSAKLKVRFYASQGQPLPHELREAQVTRAFVEAVNRYQAVPYEGRVVLYRATRIAPEFAHAGLKQGWETLAPNLEVVDVPGDHDSLVREPNIGVVASHLRAALRG